MAKGLAINLSGPYPSFLLQLEVVNYSIKMIMLNLLSSIIYNNLSFFLYVFLHLWPQLHKLEQALTFPDVVRDCPRSMTEVLLVLWPCMNFLSIFHLYACMHVLKVFSIKPKQCYLPKKKKNCCRENPKFYSGAIWLCLVGLTQLSLLDISFFSFCFLFLISYLLTMKLTRPASLFMLTGVQNNSLKLKVSVWNVLVNSSILRMSSDTITIFSAVGWWYQAFLFHRYMSYPFSYKSLLVFDRIML